MQSYRSYSFNLVSSKNNLRPNEQTQIRYSITDDTGTTVKDFALDHTKLMHFIIVRDDLQSFQHLHPGFNKNSGEFSVPVEFSSDGAYRLFADFTPANGQKDDEGNLLAVTSYQDINVGSLAVYQKQDVTPDTQTIKITGDYQMTYSIPKPIQSGIPTTITINVKKNGSPLTDMEEYLGAQAHGILLKKDSLDFAHLHTMGMGQMQHMMNGKTMSMGETMSKGPDITFDHTFPSSGIYKLFTQFQHEEKVITADYVLQVE